MILNADYKKLPSPPVVELVGFKEKGTYCINAENPFPRPHDRKILWISRASILMLRQFHSFPYSGDLYISSFKKASKTNDIFHVFKSK